MDRAALVLEAPTMPNRFFAVQLRLAKRISRRNFGPTRVTVIVLTRQAITSTLREVCQSHVRLMRVSPDYLIPYSLPRQYDRLIFIEARTLPAPTDIVYLLHSSFPVQVLDAQPGNAARWPFLAFSAAGQGLVGLDTRALHSGKQRTAARPRRLRTYHKYSIAERACLTAWARGMEFHITEGVSRRFPHAAIWQSWQELTRLISNLKHGRPLPGLTIRPRHFRLLVTHLAFILALWFAGQGWMYIYLFLAFLFSYDYFFPPERPWRESLLFLPLRLLYLPFA